MTEREFLRRIEELEHEQREHYAAGREERGDAIGEAICFLVSEARAQGRCLPDGRPTRDGAASIEARHRRELVRIR